MLRRLTLLTIVSSFFIPAVAAAQVDEAVVYVRCDRTTENFEVTGEVTLNGTKQMAKRTLTGLDVYDRLPDVSHFLGGFNAPCDLVFREPSGDERVLYDCSSKSKEDSACAAMDPAVSFDGTKVAFTVFRGKLEPHKERFRKRVVAPKSETTGAATGFLELPNRHLNTSPKDGPSGAQLHIVDIESGEVTKFPVPEGEYDTGPVFLPNGRLGFTSTRDGHFATNVWRTTSTQRGTRIWTMDRDGKNLRIASHHSLSIEEHPIILKDGRLVFSSWQIGMGLPFRHTNGAVGGFTTLDNLFHLFWQNPDGSNPFAFYGMHSGDHTKTTGLGHGHKAAHFLTQTSDGRVWFADYYRGNNSGLGNVDGVMPPPEDREGKSPYEVEKRGDWYAPKDSMTLASWSTSTDGPSSAMPDPPMSHPSYNDPLPYAGKLSHPSALPNNELMVVWAKGACSELAGNRGLLGKDRPPITSGSGGGAAVNVMTHLGIDTPGCDAGLYKPTKIPSEHPNDLEMIVDKPEWHEIMGRAVVPYEEIYGQKKPDERPPADEKNSDPALEVGTPFGLLGAASITDRETRPAAGLHFQAVKPFHLQGTDTIPYEDEDLCGIRILGVMPNRGDDRNEVYKEARHTLAGERVVVLGEFPVRNKKNNGKPRMDPSGHPDTSFLVRFPAKMPYFMQGIDCKGRTLNTDQTWQSLQPGEKKTCGGCHIHSREPRTTFGKTYAATPTYDIKRLGEGEVPLLAGKKNGKVETREVEGYGMAIGFERDIMPIFKRRCVSCHGGKDPDAGLALDRPGTHGPDGNKPPSTWWCLVEDLGQKCVPKSRRHPGQRGTALGRPQVSKYIRAFNSRGSLLYWKAANRRTDNRTDAMFGKQDGPEDHDIDFGPDHPTDITPEELGTLARWIDIGAPGNKDLLRDTQKPTLNLSAIVDEKAGAVTELRVGTVDLGSGIAPDSLKVCLVDGNGSCGKELAGKAKMHGILEVPLDSAISDKEQVVLARVSDKEGNLTELRRTIGYLLDAPEPPPDDPDVGMHADAGSGFPSPDARGGKGNRSGSGAFGGGHKGCGCRTGGENRPPASALLVIVFVGLIRLLRRRR